MKAYSLHDHVRTAMLAVALLVLTATARAGTNRYIGGPADKWEDGSKWFIEPNPPGVPPSLDDTVDVISNGFATAIVDATTVLSNGLNGCLTVSNVLVGAPLPQGVTTNTLALLNAGLATPLHILNAGTIDLNGLLLINNAFLQVDGIAGGGLMVNGIAQLDGGRATVNSLTINGLGKLILNAGVLNNGGLSVNNGLVLPIGDGGNAATYHLLGGTHNSPNGWHILAKGVLSGCGTITGSVVVDAGGVLLADCGGTLTLGAGGTNNGILRVENGGVLESFGPVINNGVIDIVSGTTNFHGNSFVNNGTVVGAAYNQVVGMVRQTSDITITWNTIGGRSYVVQASPGGPGGSFANNYGDISPVIYIPGQGLGTASYVDVGGGTNTPSRFYRVRLATTVAIDNAADPAYVGGWASGSNGGFGFNPWTLTQTSPSVSDDGFVVGSSTNNVSGTSPGIDVGGKSWGVYANGGNYTAAYRSFATGPLLVGQSFLINLDNGLIDGNQADGFALRTGNASGNPFDYNVGARFEFLYIGGDTSNSYKVVDSGGLQNIGVGFTGTGLRLKFTLTGADTYTLLVTDNASGAVTTWSGTLSNPTGGTLDSLAIYNHNAGSTSANDYFVNSLQITGP